MTVGSRVPRDDTISLEMRRFLDELARVPRNNYAATSAPAVTDDSAHGYSVGSDWINLTTDTVYKCADSTVGAAVWKQLS